MRLKLALAVVVFAASLAHADSDLQWFTTVTVEKDDTRELPIVCIWCQVRVDGTAKSEIVVIGGDVTVNGQAQKEIVVIVGDVRFGSSASAEDEVKVVGGRLWKSRRSKIQREDVMPLPLLGGLPISGGWKLYLGCYFFALAMAALFTPLVYVIFRQKWLLALGDGLRARAWLWWLVGVVVIALVVCAMEAADTTSFEDATDNAGILLILLLAAVGYTGISFVVGKRWVPRPFPATALGAFLVTTAQFIPLLGQVLLIVLLPLSIGIVMRFFFRRRRTTPASAAA